MFAKTDDRRPRRPRDERRVSAVFWSSSRRRVFQVVVALEHSRSNEQKQSQLDAKSERTTFAFATNVQKTVLTDVAALIW